MRVRAQLPIAQLIVDHEPLGPATYELAKFIEAGNEIAPIKVERTLNGQYKVKNGRHRVLAHKLLGKTHILAKFHVPFEPIEQPRPDKPLVVNGEGHIPQADGSSLDLSTVPQE